MHILRTIPALLVPEDCFLLLFKVLWLLVNGFSETVWHTEHFKKVRNQCFVKRVGFFVNFFSKLRFFFFKSRC